jgi:hypothetical protein
MGSWHQASEIGLYGYWHGDVKAFEELSAAEEDDDIDDYPEWQQDMIIKAKEVISSDDYLPLPSKFDIHEYHIMEDFCCSVEHDKIRRELLDGLKMPSI